MKPRNTHLVMDFGEPQRIDRVAFTPAGELLLEVDGQPVRPPVRTFLETSFDRPKGPKVLNRLVPPTRTLSIDPWLGIAKYKRLFAIDTNCRFVGTERVASTAIVEFIPLFSRRSVVISASRSIELRNVTAPFPERVGWLRAIDVLVSEVGFQALDVPIGLIVDSDLGSLEAFNARTLPIFGARRLPINMELVYATSDSGKEHVLNQAIAKADKVASGLFEHLATIGNDAKDFQPAGPADGYSHWRKWSVRESPSDDD
jgi:hypothetical protein